MGMCISFTFAVTAIFHFIIMRVVPTGVQGLYNYRVSKYTKQKKDNMFF